MDDKITAIVTILDVAAQRQRFITYYPEKNVWHEDEIISVSVGDTVGGITTGVYAPQKVYVLTEDFRNDIYDPASGNWSTAKAMPTFRRAFGVAVVNDILYVTGGYHYINGVLEPCSVNEQYIPIDCNAAPSSTHELSKPTTSLTTPGYSDTTSENFLTCIIAVVLVLIVGTITVSLAFYFKRRKERIH